MIRAVARFYWRLALAWLAVRWLSMSERQKREFVLDLVFSLLLGLVGLALMIIRIATLP